MNYSSTTEQLAFNPEQGSVLIPEGLSPEHFAALLDAESPYTSLWRNGQARLLLNFAKGSRTRTGFGYLLSPGKVDPSRGTELWIHSRMTHVFALAYLQGYVGFDDYLDQGVEVLRKILWDRKHGGWYSQIAPELDSAGGGIPLAEGRKEAYAHAFVTLAACSAHLASHPDAQDLIDRSQEIFTQKWWEAEQGMVCESYSRDWGESEKYRGINANMHTVEALLALYDATGNSIHLDRALGILDFVCYHAQKTNWRIHEHYHSDWRADLQYNRDRPADPFRPFGATIGHSFEWARLALQTRAALQQAGEETPSWLWTAAINLINTAWREGWQVDGKPGFIYTADGETGSPIVTERMHWVVCEAVNALEVVVKILKETATQRNQGDYGEEIHNFDEVDAARLGILDAQALNELSDLPVYQERLEETWKYFGQYFAAGAGQWWHELDSANHPSHKTWVGHPDAYHLYQALLLPDLDYHFGFTKAVLNLSPDLRTQG